MAEPKVPSLSMLDLLLQYKGRPVRVSLFDPDFKERFGRYPGVLAEALSASIRVDCLDVPPAVQVGTTATVELTRDGKVLWCHTSTLHNPALPPHMLQLAWPVTIQTEQQRRSVRADANIPVHYLVAGSGSPVHGSILNLSASGAALQGSLPLQVGQIIALMFSLGSGLFFQDIQAEVVRASSTRTGSFVSGLRFLMIRPEQAEALARWVSRRTHDASVG